MGKDELIYITVNGNQYTNINIPCNSTNLTVEMGYLPDSFSSNTGIWAGTWEMNGYVMTTYQGYFRFHSKGNAINVNSGLLTSDFNIIKTTPDTLTVNGTDYTISGSSANVSNPLQLFRGSNISGQTGFSNAYGKMSYCKVWVAGNLVRDIIPVLDDNDVACLYDQVNDVLYYSDTSTSYIAGPKKEQVPAYGYRYIRMAVTKRRGGGNGYIQWSEIQFLDNNDNLFVYPSSATVTSTTNATGSSESAQKLIDGNTSTKFCTSTSGNTTVTIDLGVGNYIDLSTYSTWRWFTANDATDRDPVTFALYVSNDLTEWELIDSVENATITTSRQSLAYSYTYVLLPSYTVEFNPGSVNTSPSNSYTQHIPVDEPTALAPNRFSLQDCVFIGWSETENGSVVYRDEEVVTNLAVEGETKDLYAVWQLERAYLVGDTSKIYTVVDGSLSELSGVTEANLTANVFINNGVLEKPSGSLLVTLTNPKVYLWQTYNTETLSADITATPLPQTLSKSVNLANSTIKGIRAITATYSGNVSVQYSGNNSSWSSVYSMEDFLELDTSTIYNSLNSAKILYLRIILNDTTATFTQMVISCDNEEG